MGFNRNVVSDFTRRSDGTSGNEDALHVLLSYNKEKYERAKSGTSTNGQTNYKTESQTNSSENRETASAYKAHSQISLLYIVMIIIMLFVAFVIVKSVNKKRNEFASKDPKKEVEEYKSLEDYVRRFLSSEEFKVFGKVIIVIGALLLTGLLVKAINYLLKQVKNSEAILKTAA